jgi:hypothetical protein|tara:strand:+ start:1222 stop:1479 length:258 start_codon:yes stop_codon:yes gene_type:complete
MIIYQNKKVTAKVKAKHIISNYLLKIFDKLKHNPEELEDNWEIMTSREEELVLDQVSLYEDRILKLLGVKLTDIQSANDYKKSIL